ncbi:MAG TPA: LysM domain-containing protein [Nannocystis sp.]
MAQPTSPVANSARVHVIQKGDVLERIAKRYGTTVDAILNANPGVDPRRLIPGRQLRIP